MKFSPEKTLQYLLTINELKLSILWVSKVTNVVETI